MMKNQIEITEVGVPHNSLINYEIETPTYMDGLKFELKSGESVDVRELVKNFFISQPIWLLTIMNNTISKSKLEQSLNNIDSRQGCRAGHWKVSKANENEIVFGEWLGFIEHRLSFYKVNNRKNEFMIMSSVKTHNKFGAFYFFFVKLVHMRLVKFAIANMSRKKYEFEKAGV